VAVQGNCTDCIGRYVDWRANGVKGSLKDTRQWMDMTSSNGWGGVYNTFM